MSSTVVANGRHVMEAWQESVDSNALWNGKTLILS